MEKDSKRKGRKGKREKKGSEGRVFFGSLFVSRPPIGVEGMLCVGLSSSGLAA
jgi:hypothetical protein